VVLGFNRLSIIDIAHSHQPLSWGPPEQPGRYKLVFNGEIYNYLELREVLRSEHGAEFATDGDGEAILAAYHHWGTEALNRLRGMFAFALWDSVDEELFCARDPFGIKPMFMATGTAGTIVGSEKKSLLDLASVAGVDLGVDHEVERHPHHGELAGLLGAGLQLVERRAVIAIAARRRVVEQLAQRRAVGATHLALLALGRPRRFARALAAAAQREHRKDSSADHHRTS
jgi:asparagine synthetase B (glutamine-hydrolysing)